VAVGFQDYGYKKFNDEDIEKIIKNGQTVTKVTFKCESRVCIKNAEKIKKL